MASLVLSTVSKLSRISAFTLLAMSKRTRNRLKLVTGLSYASYTVKFESDQAMEAPGTETLSHMYLIQNATVSCIDSATSLLTQTAQNLHNLERRYTEELEKLIQLFEMSMRYLDSEVHQSRIWEAMVEVRHEVNRLRKEREEMETMFSCAETMLNSAAEAALVAGASYASTAAVERVFSAKTSLRTVQEKRLETEHLLAQEEAKLIEKTAEYTKKHPKRKIVVPEENDSGDTQESSEGENKTNRQPESGQNIENLDSEFEILYKNEDVENEG